MTNPLSYVPTGREGAAVAESAGAGPDGPGASEGQKKSEGDGLSVTLAKLQEAFRPVLDEQRETWEREGPAAMAALEATGAKLTGIGGNCPVQAYGDVDGLRFYYRARGDSWQFHVAATDAEIFDNDLFYIDRDYGDWPDAGWMPNHEAIGFIVQAIAEYRATLKAGTAEQSALPREDPPSPSPTEERE